MMKIVPLKNVKCVQEDILTADVSVNGAQVGSGWYWYKKEK